MRRTVTLLAVVVLCLVWTYRAASGRQTQAEMNLQAAKDYQQADAELNRAYTKLLKSLEAKNRTRLKTAQLAWIKFRDAESAFRSATFEGGSAQPMVMSGVMTDLTKQRTKHLKEAYEEFNGR